MRFVVLLVIGGGMGLIGYAKMQAAGYGVLASLGVGLLVCLMWCGSILARARR